MYSSVLEADHAFLFRLPDEITALIVNMLSFKTQTLFVCAVFNFLATSVTFRFPQPLHFPWPIYVWKGLGVCKFNTLLQVDARRGGRQERHRPN